MTLRTGHGAGKGTPHVEVLPPDELPPASPEATARADRDAAGRFAAGNSVASARKLRPTKGGALAAAVVDPAFVPYARWGKRYAAHRRAELAKLHGGSISAGVGALVESEALAMAASRFVHQRAAETGDADMFKRAAALATESRQAALAGWELAARESASRPRPSPLASLRASVLDDARAAALPPGDEVKP